MATMKILIENLCEFSFKNLYSSSVNKSPKSNSCLVPLYILSHQLSTVEIINNDKHNNTTPTVIENQLTTFFTPLTDL